MEAGLLICNEQNMKIKGESKMKSKKRLAIIVICCIALVAVLAIVHSQTRTKVPEHAVAVEMGDQVSYIDLDNINTDDVEGEIVNGKGDKIEIDGDGILLGDALKQAGAEATTKVTAVADDEYSADITVEEITEPDKVYLMVEDEEASLVVFGDENSKRNVHGLVRLVVE